MKNQSVVLPLVLLVIGILVGVGGFKAVDAKNHTDTSSATPAMGGMNHNMSEMTVGNSDMASMSMSEMTSEMKGITGDEFDKKFIASMIAHHQGAIDMATMAKSQAKHEEIKKLADDIIAAQTKEITQMKEWQKQWGY